jgi:hypothetical protein
MADSVGQKGRTPIAEKFVENNSWKMNHAFLKRNSFYIFKINF